jgi:hypothetical protein
MGVAPDPAFLTKKYVQFTKNLLKNVKLVLNYLDYQEAILQILFFPYKSRI